MTGTLRRPEVGDDPWPTPTPASTSPERRRLVPSWWALGVVTIGYPVLYLLGLAAMSWIIVGCAILPAAFARRPVRIPPGMGTWLLFLAWMLVTAVTLAAADRALAFVFRYLLYLGATGFFFRTYNSLRSGRVNVGRVLGLLTCLWAVSVIGGLVGEILPTLRVPTLMEMILPASLLRQEFLAALVRAEFAQVQNLWGVVIGRPNAPYAYTNIWGSALAILYPIAIAWLVGGWGTRRSRFLVTALMILSIGPVIVSLNRGLWVCLIASTMYVTIRLAALGRFGGLVRVLLGSAVVVMLLVLTPLGSLGNERRENAHSDEGRLSLYGQAIELTIESPILGWGAPQPRTDKDGPSVGTHGHFWLVLVSHGVVGAMLFVGFWLLVAVKTWHLTSTASIWLHASIVSLVVQLPFYELFPAQLPIAMVAAATLLAVRAGGGSVDRPAAVEIS